MDYSLNGNVEAPCRVVSTRGISVLVPRSLKLYLYGRIHDPGMGFYHPRVRRDIGHEPQSNLKISRGGGFPHVAGR